VCGTWNVRGLTDLKAIELVLHMNKYNIDILCLQETRAAASIEYVVNGFVFILSGCDREERSWAGVGFIVAPWCKCRIQSYKQVSDRIASLKLKVPGGVAGVITAYAPHNMRPWTRRLTSTAPLTVFIEDVLLTKGNSLWGT
jgi:exonuclease III